MIKSFIYIGVTDEIYNLRFEVFVKEQGFSIETEKDNHDKESIFVLIKENDIPIGTGRMYKENNETYHIGRVAVKKEYRNKKIGTKVLNELENKAKELNAKHLVLMSQLDKKEFYEKCGFKEVKNTLFYEEGCPHIKMIKNI